MNIGLPEMSRIPLMLAQPGQIVQGTGRSYEVQKDGSWRRINKKENKMRERRIKKGKKV